MREEDYRIYERRTSYVLGFHGCDKETAEKLLENDTPTFKPSLKDYDLLGGGMYFWENDPVRAWEFIKEVKAREPKCIKNPTVIGAVIDLGYCLNLVERKYTDIVKDAYDDYKKLIEEDGMEMPTNKSAFPGDKDRVLRKLDRAVIEFLHKSIAKNQLRPFDTVRCIFPEGEELYEGAGFHKKTHIQISVRNPEMIKGYFRPIRF